VNGYRNSTTSLKTTSVASTLKIGVDDEVARSDNGAGDVEHCPYSKP